MAETPLGLAAATPGARIVQRLQAAPAAVALGTLAAIVGAYLATGLASGGAEFLVAPEDPWRVPPIVRFNLVLALILTLTLWGSLNEPRALARDLADLRPLVDADDREWAELAGWAGRRRSSAIASGLLGAVVGVGIVLISTWLSPRSDGELPPDLRGLARFRLVWSLVLTASLFGLMGLRAQTSIRISHFFSELGRDRTRVRLLDLDSLRPFARLGSRLALYWFVGSGIAVLLLVDADAPAVVAAVITLTLGLGVASLLLPCRGIHQRLRQAKQAELERLRREIERRSAQIFHLEGGSGAEPRLTALLAYEARIESVREWPFDTSTLVRFALFLLIPLGSWLGGALVERIVDTVLD
jgi:hypothetical protein